MAARNKPNSYFAWYNDDSRLAIVVRQLSTDDSKGTTSGEYDTFTGDGNLSGTITNMITSGSVVTATCSAAHSLEVDDTITISGTSLYDEDYTVTVVPSTTTFSFASSAVGGTADTITDITVSSGTSTVTTSAAHGYSVGDVVYIDASNNTYDEEATITSVADSTHFTYTTTEGNVSGLTGTVGDTGSFISLFINDGIKMEIHSKYETADALTDDLETDLGLDSTMHVHVLDYVKSRILEDMGDMEKSQYFRGKFEGGIAKKPTRKSGVRILLVPEL